MTANDLPQILAGEPHAFHPGDIDEGPTAQRIAGSTLPATDDTAEAVATRGARHIDGEAL